VQARNGWHSFQNRLVLISGLPEGGVGHDLVSLNIQRQRGRDHDGIAKYNAVLESLGLQEASSFADITSDSSVQQALSIAYGGDVNMIDAWIGGLAEEHVEGGIVGALFATVIGDQFQRLMHADPFFFMCDDDLKDDGLKANVIDVETVKLADILTFNTNLQIPSSANVMTIEIELP
jgi:peroxidase